MLRHDRRLDDLEVGGVDGQRSSRNRNLPDVRHEWCRGIGMRAGVARLQAVDLTGRVAGAQIGVRMPLHEAAIGHGAVAAAWHQVHRRHEHRTIWRRRIDERVHRIGVHEVLAVHVAEIQVVDHWILGGGDGDIPVGDCGTEVLVLGDGGRGRLYVLGGAEDLLCGGLRHAIWRLHQVTLVLLIAGNRCSVLTSAAGRAGPVYFQLGSVTFRPAMADMFMECDDASAGGSVFDADASRGA